MPTLVVSSSSSVNPPLPPAAFQPTLRILKRPSPSSTPGPSSTSGPSTPDSVSSALKEREARYQVARERIFGSSQESGGGNASPNASTSLASSSPLVSTSATGTNSTTSPAASIVREPLGPSNEGSDSASRPKGFTHRRTGSKPPFLSPVTPPTSP
ncbi:hypothetical protein AX17_001643 [Amanita inopinata Kibby_2008]|nr:hypothetical protein AX17_001643 [Amanita inopinata Kibby_2008]